MNRLVPAITHALRDADERRQRREAESRSRELADCLNQAREAVVVTNLDGRITFWNPGAERLFGWRSEGTSYIRLAPSLCMNHHAYAPTGHTKGNANAAEIKANFRPTGLLRCMA